MNKIQIVTTLIITTLVLAVGTSMAAWVVTKGDRVYIEDRTGERWDVTQAKSLGFVPQRFQYGIGKNAFTPLGDDDFGTEGVDSFFSSRVIGVAGENEAHAYAIDRLRYHEIANTTIEGRSIAVGY